MAEGGAVRPKRKGTMLPVHFSVRTVGRDRSQSMMYLYNVTPVDRGGFGDVSIAALRNGKSVAVKQVDINRSLHCANELTLLLRTDHTNINRLIAYFCWSVEKTTYLHFIMEFGGSNLYRVIKEAEKNNNHLQTLTVKVYMHQLLRGLLYLHGNRIVHQDIKPANLLVDPITDRLTICDLGGARKLVPGQEKLRAVTTLCYRAPEMSMGQQNCTFTVDTWAAGCVLVEMLTGRPAFRTKSGQGVLTKITDLLGSLSAEDVPLIDSKFALFLRGHRVCKDLRRLLQRHKAPDDLIDLASKMLVTNPAKRIMCVDALQHHFSNPLRDPALRMPNGKRAPDLFNFFPIEKFWLDNPVEIRKTHGFKHTASHKWKIKCRKMERALFKF